MIVLRDALMVGTLACCACAVGAEEHWRSALGGHSVAFDGCATPPIILVPVRMRGARSVRFGGTLRAFALASTVG